MAIEIRELKIKGYIDRKNESTNASIDPAMLEKFKRQILNECRAEIKKTLDRQKRK